MSPKYLAVIRFRKRRPIRYAYLRIKAHAKERGIPFSITMGEFSTLPGIGDYIKNRGRYKHCMTIDRIDNEKGYEVGNIQFITNKHNVHKGKYMDKRRVPITNI